MNRILLFIKVPPPYTGATLMNKWVYDFNYKKYNLNVHSICISYMSSLKEMGKWRLNKLLVFLSTFFSLVKELLKHKPSFVYFQVSPHGIAFYRDLIYITSIKILGTKILYHLHGKGIKYYARHPVKSFLYRFAFRNSSVICLSKMLVSDISDFHNGSVYIVPNGLPDIELIVKQTPKNDTSFKILFLSNLLHSKGIAIFLDVVRVLDKSNIDFKAFIVGAEADITAGELNSFIKANKLEDKLFYLGSKYNEEKYEIIRQIDVLVNPTLSDIWGNVNIEAMQLGKPVIASIEGAIPEIIDDGITGFLVEKSSPDQIVEKLEILIKDPQLKRMMGAAARKKYEENYTLEIFESKMIEVFKTELKKSGGYEEY